MDRETCVLTHDLARQLVASAVLAPSSHNSQPWIFRVRGRCIGVIADRTRALPANDPEDRELAISCGCALFNLRVAAAHAGLAARQRGPSAGGDPDCLGRLELAIDAAADPALAALFEAIAKRRTYRRTFAVRAVEASVLAQLADAAEREGAWLHVAEGPAQRLQAAELIAEGDETQWADPAWRRELAAWMHPRRDGDGLTLPGVAVPLAQAVVRTFDMGHGVAARDRQLADASPVLAVLGTPGDDASSHLAAGQALQRVLLTACGQGVQASYLNQAVEIAPLRAQLQKLCGRAGAPQILLRLGYPEADLPAAPRRPLDTVIEFMTGDGSDAGC